MERITMRVPALLAGNLIGQERPAPMLSIGLVGGKEEKDDWGGEEGGGGGGEERRRGGLDAGRRLCKATRQGWRSLHRLACLEPTCGTTILLDKWLN
ncbi:unnamed protein product [Prorocentrum cordatum]|uniref:Uncharacterized protein n=1 Tax=Prorocentrum cordatum TaxID=2364126 RepID=A0ABN9V4X5_9DINO|nr:unnamed protein product [Polarella glacialis]